METFEEGSCSLRAKIDMTSGNLNLRDPVLYRILKMQHHHCQDFWNIYPTYDYAHCISDALEKITHSLCSLEFEDHRLLYYWVLESLDFPLPRPRQIEFARLNMTSCLMSKRKLAELVNKKIVAGWDDPRLPTIAGLRRRGYTSSSLRTFLSKNWFSKTQ